MFRKRDRDSGTSNQYFKERLNVCYNVNVRIKFVGKNPTLSRTRNIF